MSEAELHLLRGHSARAGRFEKDLRRRRFARSWLQQQILSENPGLPVRVKHWAVSVWPDEIGGAIPQRLC
jgi:hypothetical protein